jgi:hypothetical protein
VAEGTAWLAIVVRNDWTTAPVIAGLVIVGLGQGALVTLLFNVLVTASPRELAGDVGSLRGVTQNVAAAVGTSLVGTLLVGLLSTFILKHLNDNPVITAELQDEVNLTNLNFFSDTQLKDRLSETSASPEQLTEALRFNAEARIRALKAGFLVLSGLTLLALFPCWWLPEYRPNEIGGSSARSRPAGQTQPTRRSSPWPNERYQSTASKCRVSSTAPPGKKQPPSGLRNWHSSRVSEASTRPTSAEAAVGAAIRFSQHHVDPETVFRAACR